MGVSAKDVCALIKACRGSGVKEISFSADNVHVTFFGPAPEKAVSFTADKSQELSEQELEAQLLAPLSETPEMAEVNAIARDEQEIREEQLAMLAVTDPMAFEEASVRDEFEAA